MINENITVFFINPCCVYNLILYEPVFSLVGTTLRLLLQHLLKYTNLVTMAFLKMNGSENLFSNLIRFTTVYYFFIFVSFKSIFRE